MHGLLGQSAMNNHARHQIDEPIHVLAANHRVAAATLGARYLTAAAGEPEGFHCLDHQFVKVVRKQPQTHAASRRRRPVTCASSAIRRTSTPSSSLRPNRAKTGASTTSMSSKPSAARKAARFASDTRNSEEHTSELQSLMRISYDVF